MNTYIKIALKSIYFNICFGVIYNLTIYFLSRKAYDFKMSYYLDLTMAIYYKIYKCVECNWPGYYFIQENKFLFVIVNSIFSDLLLTFIISVSFKILTNKLSLLENNIKVWRKAIFIALSAALLISLLAYLATYIYLSYNTEMNLSPNENYERYYPAILMYEKKWIYMILGFMIGLVYILTQKKNDNYNLKKYIRPSRIE